MTVPKRANQGPTKLFDDNGNKYTVVNWQVTTPSYGGNMHWTFEAIQEIDPTIAMQREIYTLQNELTRANNRAIMWERNVQKLTERLSDIADLAETEVNTDA